MQTKLNCGVIAQMKIKQKIARNNKKNKKNINKKLVKICNIIIKINIIILI